MKLHHRHFYLMLPRAGNREQQQNKHFPLAAGHSPGAHEGREFVTQDCGGSWNDQQQQGEVEKTLVYIIPASGSGGGWRIYLLTFTAWEGGLDWEVFFTLFAPLQMLG